ncbi:hypothetical protein Hanom_Chr15g01410651 [Helianthus anomalus]
MKSISSIPWQVEVFTLSTGTWRRPYSNLFCKSIIHSYSQVIIDDYLYWLVVDRIDFNNEYRCHNLIVCLI